MKSTLAIEDRDGTLYLASVERDRCWRLMSLQALPGSLLDDMTAAAADTTTDATVAHHWNFQDLLKQPGTEVIAVLGDAGRSHINSAYMRPAAREWLGESQGWGTLYVRQEV